MPAHPGQKNICCTVRCCLSVLLRASQARLWKSHNHSVEKVRHPGAAQKLACMENEKQYALNVEAVLYVCMANSVIGARYAGARLDVSTGSRKAGANHAGVRQLVRISCGENGGDSLWK